MSREPSLPSVRRSRPLARTILVVLGVVSLGFVGFQSRVGLSEASPLDALLDGSEGTGPTAEGHVPEDVTAFDEEYPAIAKLDPALLDALRRATTDAARDGIEIRVNSGWRSTAYQQELLRDAVSKHGSAAEAARWVATPETSPHVSGDAVDVGDSTAQAWLSQHGARYGLCRIYDNEPWHFELRPEAVVMGCPATYADPTHDPRMQR